MSLSNYPPGVSDSTVGAPWNEPTVPDKEFDVTCSQTLSKTVSVWTDNYVPGASGVDYDSDDEGGCYASPWHDPDDTSDTDWAEEYKREHLTPLDLIKKLRSLLLDIDSDSLKSHPCYQHKQYYISECSDWIDDETEFIEN
jgi:hypothetical protein